MLYERKALPLITQMSMLSLSEQTSVRRIFCLCANLSGDYSRVRVSSRMKAKRLAAVVSLIGALCVSSSTYAKGRGGFTEFTPVKILGKKGVIVTQAFLRESGYPADGFWKPKKSHLREVERALPTFLRKEMQSRPLGELSEVIALAPKYRRQYVGMILNGRKVIWVNCIPQKSENGVDPFANWNREIVDVSDGGSGFWGVIYDVEKHSFERLILNGSA
ncbi:MAG: hypothetical protein V7609_1223 [Verrucomicrobiota bacterium]